MKKLFFLLALSFAIFISASAAEEDYIIKYNGNAPSFFSNHNSESFGAGLYVVNKETALTLDEAGFLEYCVPNISLTYFDDMPNDTLYPNQWNLGKINAEYAWSLKTYGNDVLVGVVDSGLDFAHPDIDYSRVVGGWNFGVYNTDPNYDTLKNDLSDTAGHGTMVAGVIAAKRNNQKGICGIADKTNILVLKVADQEGGVSLSSLLNAMVAGAEYFGCDVLNISVGFSFNADVSDEIKSEIISLFNEAVSRVLRCNCIIVAAVGNDIPKDPGDHPRYPAFCNGVIGVGSTTNTENNTIAESSVSNSSVFVCAPGENIPLLTNSHGYANGSGTSFASPQVAAAAAIAKNIKPDLTPSEFASALARTSTDLGDSGRDIYYGHGLLNTKALVEYLMDGRDVYVSPIDEETSTVTLFNRTSSVVTPSSIFALYSYDAGKMLTYNPQSVTIGANDFVTRTFAFNKSGYLMHYLWNSVSSASVYDSHQYPRGTFYDIE